MPEIAGPAPVRVKRFYKAATVEPRESGHAVLLDGRPARTPARALLCAPTARLAEAVAAEWAEQGETVDPAGMRLTRLLASAIDRGESDHAAWRDAILSFLGTDLLCYRAARPESLVRRQTEEWTPLLDWAETALSLRLAVAEGVIAVTQPEETAARARALLDECSACALGGIGAATEATGSAVIAMATWKQAFPAARLFAAARLDERHQAEMWGEDAEAAAREARLEADYLAAARFLELQNG